MPSLLAAALLALALPASAMDSRATNAGTRGSGTSAGGSVNSGGSSAQSGMNAVNTGYRGSGLGSAIGTAPASRDPGALSASPEAGAESALPAAGNVQLPGASIHAKPVALPASGLPAAPGAPEGAPALPGARGELGGAVKGVAEAKAEGAALGDGLSVRRAVAKVFDGAGSAAALNAPELPAAQSAGRFRSVQESMARKIVNANTAPPADAPALYQDAIAAAREALNEGAAGRFAELVRGFARRKAEVSFGPLAAETLKSAAAGDAKETGRLLEAFGKWESLLGSPFDPFLVNKSALERHVKDALAAAQARQDFTPARIWFARARQKSLQAMGLPDGGIARVGSLAEGMALARPASGPGASLARAWERFAADPRPGSRAAVIYEARRAQGSWVPGAALAAVRYWLRAALEALWSRVKALFGRGAPAYALEREDSRRALRSDAAVLREIELASAEAVRRLASPRLTVVEARAAFDAAAKAAAAFERLAGDDEPAREIARLRELFTAQTARERTGGLVPASAADALLYGFGGLDHWARRSRELGDRRVSARFWRGRQDAATLHLGDAAGPAASAAARLRSAGESASLVTNDEQLWARGRGARGEFRAAAVLRDSGSGGQLDLLIENGSAELERGLERLGLATFRAGSALRATLSPDGFGRDAAELEALLVASLAIARGAELYGEERALRELAESWKGGASPAPSSLLAQLEGRDALISAPVLGDVDGYEAVGPSLAVVDGRPSWVSALRSYHTGELVFARASALR